MSVPIETEEPAFLREQLLTLIGNKRALLGPIGEAVESVKARLGQDRLRILDAFSGSGAVSRLFKASASLLVVNDLEAYAAAAARSHLANRSEVDHASLCDALQTIEEKVERRSQPPGFIECLYAPKDDGRIAPGERVFYTRENARRIDDYRRLLDDLPEAQKMLLLGPLLSEASIKANTSGVFKGFHKDRATGLGRFGGSGSKTLGRITDTIRLRSPVLSRFECEVDVRQEDANESLRKQWGLDLVYLDPPYNQHPYGSNYFMLNLIPAYQRPKKVRPVSGIPCDWRRSGYNTRARALPLLRDLVHTADSKFLLVSSSDEGYIPPEAMRRMLEEVGRVESFGVDHPAFRGSRNLRGRALRVTEHLFLVEKR